MSRWLLPISLALTLTGYFGPWVNHPVAGLVITGLDFGEYVKFLPVVRDGSVTLWRPGFYAPLVAASAASLLAAYRPEFSYRWWLRVPLLALAIVAALNLAPPAWTPARLLEPEFRVQTTSLLLLLAAIAFSPFLALLPRAVVATIITGLSVPAIVAPLHGFFQVLPAIQALYNRPLAAGWGLWLMVAGLLLTCLCFWRLPSPSQVQARWQA